MFTKEQYFKGFPHVSEVHFDEKPDDERVRELIRRYFGDGAFCYDLFAPFAHRPPSYPLHTWCITLPGKVDGQVDKPRHVEVALDRDTFCGERKEPFYFLVRNEAGDDAFTLAVAEGLAKFIAKEMNGELVRTNHS